MLLCWRWWTINILLARTMWTIIFVIFNCFYLEIKRTDVDTCSIRRIRYETFSLTNERRITNVPSISFLKLYENVLIVQLYYLISGFTKTVSFRSVNLDFQFMPQKKRLKSMAMKSVPWFEYDQCKKPVDLRFRWLSDDIWFLLKEETLRACVVSVIGFKTKWSLFGDHWFPWDRDGFGTPQDK